MNRCEKCQGCLEWEKNEHDWNLACRNCGKRYYDAFVDTTEQLIAQARAEAGKRVAA